MPFLQFYSPSRLSIIHTKLALFQMKQPLNYLKIFILLCLPFNTALAGTIFTDDFESGTLKTGVKQENGFYWNGSGNTSISTENSKNGTYSLKFLYKASAAPSGNKAEQRFNLGGAYKEMWIKYDLFIPSNYTHRTHSNTENNKGFVFLWAKDYSKGTPENPGREGPKLGSHFWPNSDGTSKLTSYASALVNGTYTLQKHSNGSADGSSAITKNDRGHWMTVIIHMKYATKSNNDGVMEVWKTDWQGNKTKLTDIQNGAWYSTQSFSTLAARGFDEGYLLGAANSGFDKDTVFYIDNIEFSTTPLFADSVTPPKPPTLFANN